MGWWKGRRLSRCLLDGRADYGGSGGGGSSLAGVSIRSGWGEPLSRNALCGDGSGLEMVDAIIVTRAEGGTRDEDRRKWPSALSLLLAPLENGRCE
jgi:hypothetical protein